jgi:hypothetical protein
MMETRIPLKSGDEYDAFSKRWRRMVGWKAGTIKAVKNGYRRRIRRGARKDIQARLQETV